MVSRTTVITVSIAASLLLVGCSSTPDTSTPEPSTTTSSGASATPSDPQTPAETATEPTTEAADLPDFLQPYPEATVLSSSRSAAQSTSGSPKLDQVSLVMRAKASPDDVLKFYTEKFKGGGFETYGKEIKEESARVVNFRHKDNEGLLVITVSPDPEEASNSIVTIGGTIAS